MKVRLGSSQSRPEQRVPQRPTENVVHHKDQVGQNKNGKCAVAETSCEALDHLSAVSGASGTPAPFAYAPHRV
jgi:hypothetical protein